MARRCGVILVVALYFFLSPANASAKGRFLPVVSNFNIANIYGEYYDIASYPQGYTNNCTNTSISFAPTNRAGVTSIVMSCDRGIFHPKVGGTAVPLSKTVPARMWVDLRPPVGGAFTQEFDVIMAARDFSYFVIGHASRKQLFILSRHPVMSFANVNYILSRLESYYGYTNVRRAAVCTTHNGYSRVGCQNALAARSLVDDFSEAFASGNASDTDSQDAGDEAELISPPQG